MVERMAIEDFLVWAETREERFELVDGVPQMMAGAKRRHDRIVASATRLIGNQLVGRACEPFTADTAVVSPNGNVRLPDAGVDCGQAGDEERAAREPVFVIEVLSPSTRDSDLHGKLEEYKSIPSMLAIALVDADRPCATLWSRGAGGIWDAETVSGEAAVLRIPSIGVELPFAELYARVTFAPRPRLIT